MTNGDDPAYAAISKTVFNQSMLAGGCTKRELFAAMVMQGLLSNPHEAVIERATVAADAVTTADRLIKALNAPRCKYCNLPLSDNHYDAEHDICSFAERAQAASFDKAV